MTTIYKLLRMAIRMMIDLLIPIWLWSVEQEQKSEERKRR